MTTPHEPLADTHRPKRDGNFLMVTICSAIAMIVIFIVAFLLLSDTGKKLIPGRHNPHPTSSITLPVSNIRNT